MLSHLDRLESETIYIIREAFAKVKPLAMLWSMGKDSTALLWMVRKAFHGKVPFPVILLDTAMEMDEVYAFRDQLIKDWDLDCLSHPCPPYEDMDPNLPPNTRAAMRKTEGLKQVLAEYGYKGIIAGIRRDEQGLRGKERVFSPRAEDGAWDFKNQPPEFWDFYQSQMPKDVHLRIHPILSWSELDIWKYIERENIPCCDLYFSRSGKRYRSLGEKNITFPVDSDASNIAEIIAELEVTKTSERAGRTMDNETEDSFEVLRTKGYM